MSAGEVAAGCEVLLLVRHPSKPCVLSEVEAVGQPAVVRLPAVPTGIDPDPGDYLPAAHALLGTSLPLLRANGLVWVGRGEATVLLAETEPFVGAVPAGFEWRALDGLAAAAAEPAAVREALGAWVVERDSDWSALRPPWSRAGWLARAGAWMAAEMTAAGLPPSGPPEVVQLWGISAVLRADSPGGAAYLKCSTDLFRHEAVLTRALAASMPGVLPDVIAVEPDEGWLLMKDMGGALVGGRRPAAATGTPSCGSAGCGRCPGWRTHAGDWISSARPRPSCTATCTRRTSSAPTPASATSTGPTPRCRTPSSTSRRSSRGSRRRPYATTRTSRAGPTTCRPPSWRRLGLAVRCLYVTRTYIEGLPTLMPGDAGALAGADIDWLGKTLDALDHHLDPPPR